VACACRADSVGTARVSADRERARPAFYALRGGRWRDYVTVLHPPYTLWHLSYVCIGWATSPRVHADRLALLLAAFFLAVGVGAHALDELHGRPLSTGISSPVLVAASVLSIGSALLIGLHQATQTSWDALFFVAFGGFIVVAYNLELFGGRFHSDAWFAIAWGAFPALTASWFNSLTLTASGLLVGCACFALSLAQRALSTPVRDLRRRVVRVEGTLENRDGTTVPIDLVYLRAAPERALKAMSVALPLLALGLVVLRLTL
jgi:hypothetical protein